MTRRRRREPNRTATRKPRPAPDPALAAERAAVARLGIALATDPEDWTPEDRAVIDAWHEHADRLR